MDIEWILDILFPPECLACGKRLRNGTLCDDCYKSIGVLQNAFEFDLEALCLLSVSAACNYDNDVVKTLIHGLKFRGIKSAVAPLAELLIRHIESMSANLDMSSYIVVPIPLSHQRLRERGFNQSALIAERFAKYFALPIRDDLLVRVGQRKAQSETESVAERQKNIQGCFAVKKYAGPGTNAGGILLIDDVTTSGATFLEAAQTLRANGFQNIIALAVARA
jgi:competence protein ComFC